MNDIYKKMSDEELVSLVQDGNKEVFGELMDRYLEKLSRYGKRFISGKENIDDAIQDIFIKTYQNIQSFDSTRKFSSWIYRIAHNTFVNVLRKKTTEPIPYLYFDQFVAHPIYEDTTTDLKEEEEMRVLINKGIESLPAMYREIVTLYYFEEMDYKQISEILEIPMGTVAVRLNRARAMVKKHFTENNLK